MNSEYAVMDVDVEHENEFQGIQLDNKFQLLSDVSSNSEEVSVIMQAHASKFPEAEMCLNLSTHHYASEPIVQEVVEKIWKAFTVCKQDFLSTLDNINLPDHDKESVKQVFINSFCGLTNGFNTKIGLLRNTYMRKDFFKKNFNIIF